ncbi:PH domain-containing protein [Micromonospora sp. WMMD558]|uniref:PH domain-containing protein n=1 Tax=unclassified Micromonospora TaxID=2617518 RepID=UPI001E3EBE77|nr:PH domain-containing protein [Micromonospora sp. WMMC415]
MRLFTGTLAVLGTVLFAFIAFGMAARWRQVPSDVALAFTGFAAVWLTFAWRLHRTALVVSRSGVRVRWLWRTRTVPWEQIRGFHSGPDWLVPERLWLRLRDGTKVRTPVRRRRTTVYRLRDGGTALASERYEELFADLERWKAEVARQAHPAVGRAGRHQAGRGPS